MRTLGVVVADPAGDQLPGVTEVAEQRLVEALVPELAVVGFAEGVLRRFAGSDVVSIETPLLRPRQQGVRGELRPIV